MSSSSFCMQWKRASCFCLAFVAVVCVSLAGSQSAFGGSLATNTSIANDGKTVLAGSLNVITSASYTYGSGSFQGTVKEVVLSGDNNNPYGGLDFIYQFKATQGDLVKFSARSFLGYLVDASAVGHSSLPNVLLAQFGTESSTGGLDGSLPIQRNSTGNSVSFSFQTDATNDPVTSVIMIVRTNATGYDSNGTINVTDNNFASIASTLEPAGTTSVHHTPEPASMILLGIGVAGMAGYGWRRRGQVKAESTPAV